MACDPANGGKRMGDNRWMKTEGDLAGVAHLPREAHYQRSKSATYRWHMSHGQDETPTTPWGRYVKGLTERPDWSVARLARESGIDRGTVFRWIRGSNERVTVESVKTIAVAAGDDVDRALRAAAGLPIDEDEPTEDEIDQEIAYIEASDLPEGQKRAMIRFARKLQADQRAEREALRQRQATERRSHIRDVIDIARRGGDPDPQPAT